MLQSLIVFSHLRWNFVYQRPQHLITRLARHYKVFYFEEPVHTDGPSRLDRIEVANQVTVCRPHTSVQAVGFHDDQLAPLQTLLDELLTTEDLGDYAVWLYTPMALPLLQNLSPAAIVYDCMDELSAFLHAPRQLLQREAALLKVADVVFTGGPSLYRAKQDRHANVHCFASSVDREHYAAARDTAIAHVSLADLPHPRLGYFGVIDERMDLELLAQLADSRPDWQIALVGPVVKIATDRLPRRNNLHYFGQRAYDDLPKFVAGWDVCLLPFALNAATRYVSPTKTLEYMAAEKSIVSTAITDVVDPYGHVVYCADSRENFVLQCDRALAASADELETRRAMMRDIVARTSWDQTAGAMKQLLEQVASRGAARTGLLLRSDGNEMAATASTMPRRHLRRTADADFSRSAYDTIIIGAGPTGLSAAYHLGDGSLLLDQNEQVGGWCRSFTDSGFTFDYAGHIMFSNDPGVQMLCKLLLRDNVHWQDREAWIYSKNVYTRYPFQGSLYGLPPDVLKECIVGAIEARFGELKTSAGSASAGVQISSSACVAKAESITDCCADGSVEGHLVPTRLSRTESSEPRNFEEFIYSVWGAGVAKHFAIPYNRKLWAVPLAEMETSWLGGRVPLPDLEEMIEGALRPVPKPSGPNARFGYPLRGGFQALMSGFLPHLQGDLRLKTRVAQVLPSLHELATDRGDTYRYDTLISTAPLSQLIRMIGSEAPAPIREAAGKLRHVSVRCVNLGIGRSDVTDKHWIYYPEDTVFHRIFVQGNASPYCNPPGGFGLTCEITYAPSKPLPCDGDELIDLCIRDCIRVGLIREDDRILARNQIDMPHAYVVYDHARKQCVEVIRKWLLGHDIILAGRYGEWEYYNSDHAFIAGMKAAQTAKDLRVARFPAALLRNGPDARASSAGPP